MLYEKSKTPRLDMALFRAPTAEYRGTPFWAWNCRLEEDELLRQIDILREMGFGGFHMHSRCGMGSTYLGEEFMHMVKACTEKAKREGMLAWLYDEDRWPSGSAGGYVTRDPAMRGRYLAFTLDKDEAVVSREDGICNGKTYLLAAYDILLDPSGRLLTYRRIADGEAAEGEVWYVYVKTVESSGWYNGQAYVDTLSPEAMRRFVDITYNAYEGAVGEDFGKTVPAIFTDEPQFVRKTTAAFGTSHEETRHPYTPDFPETYRAAYGEDFLDTLPEIRWDRADGTLSAARYRYHDHVCERFCSAFIDACGDWCAEHGIALTGHMMEEPTLESQTHSLGEAMRCYRNMTLPGIDMLCDYREFSTAKQCQSVVHQYGREGMLSELYGVTGWHFDFRSHKFQGDWQAALGVTIRVPHLSWVTMKGSGKRDYPASINYQAPWYREYSLIEDHFARVATVLTRGKPVVRVGVIHPIESFWMIYGPNDASEGRKKEMEERYTALLERLLFSLTDFDLISESLLPSLYRPTEDARFAVGEMAYDAIVVPELLTIRAETVRRLTEFVERGGRLIFIGDAPRYVDGHPSDACLALYARAAHTSSASCALLDLLDDVRELSVFGGNGAPIDDLLSQMREDGDVRYLFLARGKKAPKLDSDLPRSVKLCIRGHYHPTLLNTQNGEEETVDYQTDGKQTVIYHKMGMSDSLLLRLSPSESAAIGETCHREIHSNESYTHTHTNNSAYSPEEGALVSLDFKSTVAFARTEPNVLVLDMAEWSLDGEQFSPMDEVLRIDRKIRKIYGYPKADGKDVQPWVIPDEPITQYPILRFRFSSEVQMPLTLAYEELCAVTFNGTSVPVTADGWYVDRKIRTMPLPPCRVGENELVLRVPIGKRVSIENFFLLGDFDVRCAGCFATILPPRRELGFGSVVSQGMPFYGGSIQYRMEFEAPAGRAVVRVSHYRGAMMRLYLDGQDVGELIYSPYEKEILLPAPGKHTLEILLYGNRANTFGCLHLADETVDWLGPIAWYSVGAQYSYEYQLKPFGILASPVITVYPA